MSLPTKPALAALFSRVMELRYPHQPYTDAMGEDYTRVAMDGDPVVLLEAAWDWFRLGTKNYRPSPGELREIAKGWVPDDKPYVSLHRALELAAGGSTDPGLHALIARLGQNKFASAGENLMPSHITAWIEANREHRIFVFAKTRMMDRNAAPWNPAEVKGLAIAGARDALSLPASKKESTYVSLAEGLADQKRIR